MRSFQSTSLLWLVPSTSLVRASGPILVERATKTPSPSPISIPPSQYWDGDDGPWSSFDLQVGTPIQNVRVFVSTASEDTWVVLPDGCATGDSKCAQNRGGSFNPNTSSTWSQHGYFELSTEETLNMSGQAVWGNDTLGLGIQGSGGPTLQNQIIAAYATEDFYLGIFGLNPSSTNFSQTDQGRPSYLTTLKNQSLIPSLSFGYTAGNQYRLKQVFGSLTLGGYDSSLFAPNPLSFGLAPDSTRNLMVGIQSISSVDQNGTTSNLLPNGIMALVDSTVPQIWLPLEACQAFQKAFRLRFDEQSELYLVDDALHTELQNQNATITFTLGSAASGGQTTNITLPYNSFDLLVTPPTSSVSNSTRYFPLRIAANDTQYTLGRTFLQEAYLTVDWERQNFSISQCVFSENAQQHLVAISSTSALLNSSSNSTSSGNSSSSGKTVGIAVGVTVGVLVILGAVGTYFFLKRRHRPSEKAGTGDKPYEQIGLRFGGKPELGTGIDNQRFEMQGSDPNKSKQEDQAQASAWVNEKANHPGGWPAAAEADGDDTPTAELGSEMLLGQRYHEMYDPSSHQPPVELPADDQPTELRGSLPTATSGKSAASSSRRSANRSSALSSWMKHISLSGRKSQSRPSISNPIQSASSAAPPPPMPSRGPSTQHRSATTSPPSTETLSPVSRHDTFSQGNADASRMLSNDILSPLSPESPEPNRGPFGRRS
ncbi:hypothetical protein MMC28_001067 [Mycoblastus sanguinarius]|nr:hypothetical protein [Mycoblastus sanguinarius]